MQHTPMVAKISTAAMIVALGLLPIPRASSSAAQAPAASAAQPALEITHRGRAVRPGEVLELTATSTQPLDTVTATLGGRSFPFWPDGSNARWRGLIGLDVETEPGPLTIAIAGTHLTRDTITTTYTLDVSPASFRERHLKVEPKYVEPPPEVRARIEREAARLGAIYQSSTTDLVPDLEFVAPVPHRASSPFGARSVFNGVPLGRHSGVDFDSPAGAVIRAPSPGRIALVDDLYYTGNTVVMDHGRGLISVFAHMAKTTARADETVATGAPLGTVGATGRATGPHLHWTVRISGTRVDPLSLLALAARTSNESRP